MIKKILIVLVIICVGFIVFINTSFGKELFAQKSIRTDQISDRSREYVKSQKDENELWRTTDLSKKGATKATIFNVDGCFDITIPYNILVTRKDSECDYQINTGRPKTTIITYLEKVNISSIEDDSGVKLRRIRNEEYSEYSQKAGELTFLVFKKKKGVFDVNAFSLNSGKMLVVNMKGYTADDFTNDFHDMLNSVQLNQEYVFKK